MFTEPLSLPFLIIVEDEIHVGSDVRGLARVEDKGLILEYQEIPHPPVYVEREYLYIYEFEINLDEIESVKYKLGLRRDKLIIKTYKISTLKDMPGSEQGQLILLISRKDKKIAKRLIKDLQARISTSTLEKMLKGGTP